MNKDYMVPEADPTDVLNQSPAVIQQKIDTQPVLQNEINAASAQQDAPIITEDNPNYFGRNDIYGEVLPYKLNIFGEQIETKSINPAKIAYDIATLYNGVNDDDFLGYYFAPYEDPRESWVSAATKGTLRLVTELPKGVAGLVSLGADAASLADGDSPSYVKQAGDWFYNTMSSCTDAVNNYFGLNPEDDRFSTKLFGGVGSVISSFGLMALASKAGKVGTAIAIMNGGVYDEVRDQALANGVSPLGAMTRGAGAVAATNFLERFGFERATAAFRGVVKRTAGAALENTSAIAASKGFTSLAKNALKSDGKIFWESLGRGALNASSESATEVMQNLVQRGLAGNMGNDYWQNYFEEDVITALSSFIVTGIGIPFEVRQSFAEHDAAKKITGSAAKDIVALSQAHDKLKNLLVSKGMEEAQVNLFLDDMITNGVEHAKQEFGDVVTSLNASVKQEDLQHLRDIAAKVDLKTLADSKFKDLDARVVESLKGVDLTASDKLLIRGAYQGIANWLAYTGVSPDSIDPLNIMTNAKEAKATPEERGYFNASKGTIFIRNTKKRIPKKIKEIYDYIDSRGGADFFFSDSFRTELIDKFGEDAYIEFSNYERAEAPGVSPYDSLVKNLKLVQSQNIPERMKTIIHEFSHFLDFKMLGIEDEAVLDKFLDKYLGAIERVFGEEGRNNVSSGMFSFGGESMYTDSGEIDFGEAAVKNVKDSSYAKDDRGLNLMPANKKEARKLYTDPRNSTEYFAQAMGRLGIEAAEAIGLKGDPSNFVTLINAILRGQDNFVQLSKPLQDYLKAFEALVKNNSELVKGMVKAKGTETLNAAMQNFLNDPNTESNWKGITFDDIKELAAVAESYTDGEAAKMVDSIFDDVDLSELKRDIDGLAMFETALQNPEMSDQDVSTIFQDRQVLSQDNSVLAQSPRVGDVFEEQQNIKSGKEKSALEKQLSTKVGGHTLDEDLDFLSNVIKQKEENKPLSKMWKFLTKCLDNIGLDGFIFALGGQKALDHFNLIHKHELFDDINTELHNKFSSRVQSEVLGIKEKDPGYSLALQKFENDCAVKKTEVDYVDPRNGKVVKRKLSAFDLMNIKLVARQKERAVDEQGNPVGLSPHDRLQKSLPNNKVEDLVKLLTPEQSKYADIMSEEVNKSFERLSAAYKEHGVDIDLGKGNENYWMLLDSLSQSMGQDYTVSTIKRNIYADSSLGVFDAREQFNRYISHVAGVESEFYATVKRLKDVFFYSMPAGSMDPKEVKIAEGYVDASRRMYAEGEYRLGTDLFERFNNLLDDFLTNRSKNLVSQSLLSKAARNITTGILSWKPIQFVKNTSNFFSFWGLAEDQGQYWSDTVAGLMNPVETWKFMMDHSSVIRKRMRGQSYNEFLNAATSGGDNFLAELFKNANGSDLYNASAPALNNYIALTNVLKKAGLSPMIYGDAMANVFGGYALLQQYIKKYNGDINRASIAFDEAILRRQSSSNQALRSLTQRSWNRKGAGNLLTFTTEGVQKWSNIIQTIEQYHQGEISGKQAAMSVSSNISSSIAYALISAAVIDLFTDDDDEEKRKHVYDSLTSEAISFAAGASIFGNAIVTPVINEMMGNRTSGVSIAAATEFLNMARNLHKGEYFKLMAQSAGAAGFFVGAPNFLSIFSGVQRAATGEKPEERRAGYRQATGRTESFSNKREGVKEKPLTKDKE